MTSTVHSVRVDNVPPSGSIEINDDASWTNSASVTLGLSASDGGSGLDKMRLRNAGESWTDNWIDFSATQVWTLTVGDGSKQVDVEYRDVAGNSEQYADSISLDTTAPGVALTAVAQGTVVELEWSASDAGAGLDGCELVYQEGEGSWQALSTSCSGTDTFTPTLPRVWYTFHLTATVPSTALRGCCANNVSNTAVATATASVRDCTKYYYLGAQRVAMRDADDDVFWLHGDHLGSTSFTTDEEGDVVARQLYYPFGETRWVTGTLSTDFGFTGQRDDAYTQLYQMGARWYDGGIGRWISPDSIIPDPTNPQSLNPLCHNK
jgi:RHS repeat-associated protein